MTTVPSNPVAGDGASGMATVLQQQQGYGPSKALSLDLAYIMHHLSHTSSWMWSLGA